MDAQHDDLEIRIERVRTAIRGAADKESLLAAFAALVEATVQHFAYEEETMQVWAAPGLERHAREHAEIVEWLRHYLARLEADASPGALSKVGEEILDLLSVWFTGHVREFDVPTFAWVAQAARL